MKYVIGLNVLLAMFFASLAILLYKDIESMKVAKNTDPVYLFAEFTRKPVVLPEKWRNTFGATHTKATVADALPDTSAIIDKIATSGIVVCQPRAAPYFDIIRPFMAQRAKYIGVFFVGNHLT